MVFGTIFHEKNKWIHHGPFENENYQNEKNWNMFEYFVQQATGLSCIKCWHGFAQFFL